MNSFDARDACHSRDSRNPRSRFARIERNGRCARIERNGRCARN